MLKTSAGLVLAAKEEVSSSSQRSSSSSNGISDVSSRLSQVENNAVPATSLALEAEGHGLSATVSSSEILAPVRADMDQLTVNLKNVVGQRSPLLHAAADQIFQAGGKRLRPAIVFLVARATIPLTGLRCALLLRLFSPSHACMHASCRLK